MTHTKSNILEQPYTIKNIQLKRVDDTLLFHFFNDEKKLIRIYSGNKPNYKDISTKIAEGQTNHFTVELLRIDAPCYFYAEIGSKKTPIFGERILPLEGALNLRDLGGYTTENGKIVRWGMLYRSDHLTKLTEEDIKILERINLKTIIDLRSEHEKKVYPNKKISTVEYILNCNPESHFAELAGKAINLADENKKLIEDIENGIVDPSIVNNSGTVSIESYQNFVDDSKSQEAFGTMLKWLANPESVASVHHCRGGKDRTGFGSMLILSLLGVNEEQILEDYLITKKVREERNLLKLEQYKKLTDNQNYLDYLMTLIDTRKDYLMTAINRINDFYGGITSYALNQLGLTTEEIAQLRKIYLKNE